MTPFEPFSAVAVETIYVACNSYILVGEIFKIVNIIDGKTFFSRNGKKHNGAKSPDHFDADSYIAIDNEPDDYVFKNDFLSFRDTMIRHSNIDEYRQTSTGVIAIYNLPTKRRSLYIHGACINEMQIRLTDHHTPTYDIQ